MHPSLRVRLERCSTLPSLPLVTVRLLQLCQKPDVGLEEIAKVIANDPGLAAKVTRVVNSPAMGLRQEVRTLPHAVALLGVNAVRTLVLSFSVVREAGRLDGTSLHPYWKRSVLSAAAARELAADAGFLLREEAFLAALLQDIGILALLQACGPEYERLLVDARGDHDDLMALERKVLGSDHADVGRWLVNRWRLPERIADLVTFGHHPERLRASTDDELVRLVRSVALAGPVAGTWLAGHSGDSARQLSERADQLGVSREALEPVLERLAAAIPEISALFEIDLGTADEVSIVLEQAQEALVLASVHASRQAQSASATIDRLTSETRRLQIESERDPLTGVANRRRSDAYLEQEFERARRSGEPLSLLLADLDHFKKVNDTRGHPAGDAALRSVARRLGARLRERDLLGRYGGEEFILILPHTPLAGARVVAERLRQGIAAEPHDAVEGEPIPLTISVGCACTGNGRFDTAVDLLTAADQALYAAKRIGRNRVEVHEPEGDRVASSG